MVTYSFTWLHNKSVIVCHPILHVALITKHHYTTHPVMCLLQILDGGLMYSKGLYLMVCAGFGICG